MRRLIILFVVVVLVAVAWMVHKGSSVEMRQRSHAHRKIVVQPPKQAEKGMGTKMTEPAVVTSVNFGSEVLKLDIPVVVDFWASWCGPCRIVSPILDELAEKYQGKVKVVKVNVDEQRELAGRYEIQAIPTLIIFKNGEIIDKVVGAESKAALTERFEELSRQ